MTPTSEKRSSTAFERFGKHLHKSTVGLGFRDDGDCRHASFYAMTIIIGSKERMHKISIHSQREETGLTFLIVVIEVVDVVIDKEGTALESDNQQSKSSKTVVPLFGQYFLYQFHCNLCQRHDVSEACGRRQA